MENPIVKVLYKDKRSDMKRGVLDQDVAATLVLRIWSLFAGALSVVAVPLWLNKVEQGYYYTFFSVLALQVFFELGLNHVLVQFGGNARAKIGFGPDDSLEGDALTLERVKALVLYISRAFAVLAVLFFVLIYFGGISFFDQAREAPPTNWKISWLLLTFFTAGNLFMSPLLALAEGLGRLRNIARLRTFQSMVGYLFAWFLMYRGNGLISLPCIAAANFFGYCAWLAIKGRFLWQNVSFFSVLPQKSPKVLVWSKEILPFQWRIAVSWISGYLVFHLFNPVFFTLYGPSIAGKIGLTLTVFSSTTSLTMSWVNAKVPDFAKLIGAQAYHDAQRLFTKQFFLSFGVQFLAVLTLLFLIYIGRILYGVIGDRVADFYLVIPMALVALSNHIIFAMALYMRSHGEEPMLLPSITTGLLVALSLLMLGPISIGAVLWAYALIQTLIGLVWTSYIFRRRYWKNSIS